MWQDGMVMEENSYDALSRGLALLPSVYAPVRVVIILLMRLCTRFRVSIY